MKVRGRVIEIVSKLVSQSSRSQRAKMADEHMGDLLDFNKRQKTQDDIDISTA